jgi:hypothetical protein
MYAYQVNFHFDAVSHHFYVGYAEMEKEEIIEYSSSALEMKVERV